MKEQISKEFYQEIIEQVGDFITHGKSDEDMMENAIDRKWIKRSVYDTKKI